ncbi:MAG: DGQHR domain-containing protein [Chloroflexota bacterium]|nr:DGQHR domain-containing protein [Chloroflexota bacterium]
MATISRPAVEIKQGNLTLYLTYFTPLDLFSDNFYTVDSLEPDDERGFQRILNEKRAGRLSRHLTESFPGGYAHLPTTVFLATDKPVRFDSTTGMLEFETEQVCPFSVVDGQHRIEGLRLAAKSDFDLQGFKLPVTVATELDTTHQMYHFFIVNTTQVPVEASLHQQITKRFTDMQGVEDLPYLPHWIKKDVSLGRDARALRILDVLNSTPESPLYNRIQMANDPVSRNRIKQSSIANIIKSEVLTGSNPLSIQETDSDRQARIMLNYFRAIEAVFVADRDRDETVVFKSSGLFFFLGISKWVFNAIYSTTADFTVDSIATVIRNALERLDDTFQHVGSPDWWMPGPLGASGLNRSAARTLISAFQTALAEAQSQSRRIVL